jgi:hypothetical protein
MLVSILIIAVSLVLLAYWFRYTCVLLLKVGGASECATRVAAANHLNFPEVLGRLQNSEAKLDSLELALERDYRILNYLLEHSAGLEIAGVEHRILTLDYRIMQIWYKMVRRCSSDYARAALVEMARVLTYLSGKMGERLAQYTVA